jgi:hypothetical protein
MNIFREDFCSKLNLLSTTSSNEDGESAHNKMLCEGELPKETLTFASPSVNSISGTQLLISLFVCINML